MAIEHRAIFALSIAFTASIVAFPDLPPDIPPRAGFDGPFVGAPFVAFFLPIAAIVMWWIVDNASGRPARERGAADVQRRRGHGALSVGVPRDDAHRLHRRTAVAGARPGGDGRARS